MPLSVLLYMYPLQENYDATMSKKMEPKMVIGRAYFARFGKDRQRTMYT